jgi:hypothetical protein
VPVNNLPAHHVSGRDAVDAGNIQTDGNTLLLPSATQGLGTAPCDQNHVTLVRVDGSGDELTTAPGAGAVLTNGGGEVSGSCFIVGALRSVSSINANSLRVGDQHRIYVFTSTGITSYNAEVNFIVLSTKSGVSAVADISGGKGPLDISNSGALANTLTAGGGAAQITNATGGGILICYKNIRRSNSGSTASTFTIDPALDTLIIENLTTHLSTPGSVTAHEAGTSLLTKKINVYSFALKPEEHQPSGTCNFSRIDNAKLNTNLALATGDNIYAVNYNVLRIMSGMGGLAYSN